MNTSATLDHDQALTDFRSDAYLRINARRLEHLASLGLPLSKNSVLEVGAGIGDLTEFFLDRSCTVTALEGRESNASHFRRRFANEPRAQITVADLNAPPTLEERFDITFCYGLLYHLSNPEACIEWMARHTAGILLLSTCVTPDSSSAINPMLENARYHSQALDGVACRPTRAWVYNALQRHMPHVYTTITQPHHDEFPLDWNAPTPSHTGLHRCVFIASRTPIEHDTLHYGLLMTHHADPTS